MNAPAQMDVIIAARNGSHIDEAVASVLAQKDVDVRVTLVLRRTKDPIPQEILDTASDQVTLLVSAQAESLGSAWNLGLAQSRRSLVAFMDSNDLWPDRRMLALAATMAAESADVAYGSSRIFYDPSHEAPGSVGAPGLVIEGASPVTALFTRHSLDRVGPLDPGFPYLGFFGWLTRASSLGLRAASTDQVTLDRRILPNGDMTVDLASHTVQATPQPAGAQR